MTSRLNFPPRPSAPSSDRVSIRRTVGRIRHSAVAQLGKGRGELSAVDSKGRWGCGFSALNVSMDKLIKEIMKTLVIFDTNYGNTKFVADSIAGELGEGARSVSVKDLRDSDLAGIGLLVVGSPIIG